MTRSAFRAALDRYPDAGWEIADEDADEWPDIDSRTGSTFLGYPATAGLAIPAYVALDSAADGTTLLAGAMVVGIALAFVHPFPVTRRLLDERTPIEAYNWHTSIRRSTVTGEYECTACGSMVDRAGRRVHTKLFVIAGVRLTDYDAHTEYRCTDCVPPEKGGSGPGEVARERRRHGDQ